MISRIMISLRKAADPERGDLSPAGHAATVAGAIEFVRPRRGPSEEQSYYALNALREAPVHMASGVDANGSQIGVGDYPQR